MNGLCCSQKAFLTEFQNFQNLKIKEFYLIDESDGIPERRGAGPFRALLGVAFTTQHFGEALTERCGIAT
jgi:hypothetical protein